MPADDEEGDQRGEGLRGEHGGLLGALDLDEAAQGPGAEVHDGPRN